MQGELKHRVTSFHSGFPALFVLPIWSLETRSLHVNAFVGKFLQGMFLKREALHLPFHVFFLPAVFLITKVYRRAHTYLDFMILHLIFSLAGTPQPCLASHDFALWLWMLQIQGTKD